MKKTITQDDLVLYAYNELNSIDSQEVENAVNADPLLLEQLQEIIEMQGILDTACTAPNPTSLQIILEESASALEVL